MAWYVFALVDRVPSGSPGRGLSSALSVRSVAGGFAVIERRADVPPVAFGTLTRHQAIVSALAARVPAILPVRFGTLLEPAAVEEALDERDEEIASAFDLVRDRVQFTWRLSARKAPAARGRKVAPTDHGVEPSAVVCDATVPALHGAAEPELSGTAYLHRAARAANPLPPVAFRRLHAGLAALVVKERYQPATATLPEAMYHLVERVEARRYRAAAEALDASRAALKLSGPFPPFAFAPEFL